jgi:hypothetical protein
MAKEEQKMLAQVKWEEIESNLRFDRTMGIHMGCVIGFSHKCTRTDVALERLCATVGVCPMMLLQIPLCAELLTTYGARVLLV